MAARFILALALIAGATLLPGRMAQAASDLLHYSHSIELITLTEQPLLPMITGSHNTGRLLRPVALGGRNHILYIADADAMRIYRYDDIANTFTLLRGVAEQLQGEAAGFYVDEDMSFFVADPAGGQVLQFSRDGQLLHRYRDPSNLSRPVAIALDWPKSQILIADGMFDRVIVFNRLAWPLHAFEAGTDPATGFKGIVDMTQGTDGIYVLNRLNRQVHKLNLEGQLQDQFDYTPAINPSAIAVDRDQRIYIADAFDDTIRIYRHGQLVETIGGSGRTPGRFRGITDLWVERGSLYVADSLNGRVQVFSIMSAPQSGNDRQ